ncbi:hypothetical protein [Puniceibacterium confluentis]|nr:hypothetical protein [Puniceibacterium confluentis]
MSTKRFLTGETRIWVEIALAILLALFAFQQVSSLQPDMRTIEIADSWPHSQEQRSHFTTRAEKAEGA